MCTATGYSRAPTQDTRTTRDSFSPLQLFSPYTHHLSALTVATCELSSLCCVCSVRRDHQIRQQPRYILYLLQNEDALAQHIIIGVILISSSVLHCRTHAPNVCMSHRRCRRCSSQAYSVQNLLLTITIFQNVFSPVSKGNVIDMCRGHLWSLMVN